MASTNITEKTLELNICEEILADIRQAYPKAFWYGPSTRSERNLGFDASLEGVEGHLLFLQFKRPLKYSASSPKKFPYWFKVESEQHDTLYSLATKHQGCVYYVFPLIGDHRELVDDAPALTQETLYVPVESAGQLETLPNNMTSRRIGTKRSFTRNRFAFNRAQYAKSPRPSGGKQFPTQHFFGCMKVFYRRWPV